MEQKAIQGQTIHIPLPAAAVLHLRKAENISDRIYAQINYRDANWHYPIYVMRMWKIDAKTIIRHRLYVLIPFFIFSKTGHTYLDSLKTNTTKDISQSLINGYRKMYHLLEDGVKNKEIDAYLASLIKSMTLKVLRNALPHVDASAGNHLGVTKHQLATRKEIEKMFSGELLEFPAHHFMEKGFKQGIQAERANTERERMRADRAEKELRDLKKQYGLT